MRKKLTLDVDALAVVTFATAEARERDAAGTVHGQAKPCTAGHSCFCPTAYYHCGTGPATIYSCDATLQNCPDTSPEACG